MKKAIFFMAAITAMLFTACDDDDKLPDISPSARGTVTDDLGNTYEWVRIGEQDWTTSNAKNGPWMGDIIYWDGWDWKEAFSVEQKDDLEKNYYPIYGNMMSYKDALESAPEGWRLPSDEDWMKLEKTLGMGGDVKKKGFRGNGVAEKMQEENTGCCLGLKLGGVMTRKPVWGWFEYDLDNQYEYAFYWTSTLDNTVGEDREAAYYRKIFVGSSKVGRESGTTDRYLSVRWVRDVK